MLRKPRNSIIRYLGPWRPVRRTSVPHVTLIGLHILGKRGEAVVHRHNGNVTWSSGWYWSQRLVWVREEGRRPLGSSTNDRLWEAIKILLVIHRNYKHTPLQIEEQTVHFVGNWGPGLHPVRLDQRIRC